MRRKIIPIELHRKYLNYNINNNKTNPFYLEIISLDKNIFKKCLKV